MNEPKDERRRASGSDTDVPGGTPPSGGELDQTMGGADNTADDSVAAAREAAREKAERGDRPGGSS